MRGRDNRRPVTVYVRGPGQMATEFFHEPEDAEVSVTSNLVEVRFSSFIKKESGCVWASDSGMKALVKSSRFAADNVFDAPVDALRRRQRSAT